MWENVAIKADEIAKLRADLAESRKGRRRLVAANLKMSLKLVALRLDNKAMATREKQYKRKAESDANTVEKLQRTKEKEGCVGIARTGRYFSLNGGLMLAMRKILSSVAAHSVGLCLGLDTTHVTVCRWMVL